MTTKSIRNCAVENAVSKALAAIDDALAGVVSNLPTPALRKAVDDQIKSRASVRAASFFLLTYSTCDLSWDCDRIPTGVRGKHGDKRLASAMSELGLTLHDNITAFGENLGWKGNVTQFRLVTDKRFKDFAQVLKSARATDREAGIKYFAGRFAASRRLQEPLPALPPEVLSFARARMLFQSLIKIPSAGHIQQFVVAGLLRAYRRRFGHIIKTHHPHASDTFDGTSGDVEEFSDGKLVAAYEITDRDDWKNRLQDFRQKMAQHGLRKYCIIASKIYDDAELVDPVRMLAFLQRAEADLAVVEIKAFVDVFVAELTADELRAVINEVYADLTNPTLSNRQDFIDAYSSTVGEWLDFVS